MTEKKEWKPAIKPFHIALAIGKALGGAAGRDYLNGYRRRRSVERAACGLTPFPVLIVKETDENK